MSRSKLHGSRCNLQLLARREREHACVAFELRAWDVVACGPIQAELGVAALVVLGIAAQRVSRCEHHLRGLGVHDIGVCHPQARGRAVGTVAHAGGAAEGTLVRHQTVEFHTECTRHQRIGGWQQGIGSSGQAGHATANGDLTTDSGIACTMLGTHGSGTGLYARDDGVDRIGG